VATRLEERCVCLFVVGNKKIENFDGEEKNIRKIDFPNPASYN
jgi:hypothetical protein